MASKARKAVVAKDAWAWLTKEQAALVTGYSVRQFTDKIQPRLDATATRDRGAKLRFDIRAVGSALVAYVAELNRPKPEDVDPLMGDEGESSDALERYRTAAALEKELKNAGTQKQLVNRATVLDAMTIGFSAAAGCGKKLVIKYGNDAGDIWNEGIDAMRDAAVAALKPEDDAARAAATR